MAIDPALATCNPATLKDTKNTCLPHTVLDKLVQEWNKKNKEAKIHVAKDKRSMWLSLRRHLLNQNKCGTELCLLQDSSSFKANEKKELQEKHFRPMKTKEMIRDPDVWLNTDNIEDVMEQYEAVYPDFEFIGPVPIDFAAKPSDPMWGKCIVDELCSLNIKQAAKQGTSRIGIVFNIDPHDKPGRHWVSLFIDIKGKHACYFDSFGELPPPEVEKLLTNLKDQGITRISYNDIRHQKSNTECGMFSIYFLIAALSGRPIEQICMDALDDKLMLELRDVFFLHKEPSQKILNDAHKKLGNALMGKRL